MERLTKRLSNGNASWNYPIICFGEDDSKNKVFKSVHRQKACEKLAAYEDTGLEPEELEEKQNEAYDLGYQSCLNYKGLRWDEAEELQRYREIGSIDRLRELAQAEKEGQLVFITEKMALAMIAGARAIEKNKRLQGVIYNYDVFGKLGAPKEISYFEAAKVLREAAEAALEEREAEHDKHTPDKV